VRCTGQCPRRAYPRASTGGAKIAAVRQNVIRSSYYRRMNETILITRSENGTKGRYEAVIDTLDGSGELTYSRMSATRIIADHTGVADGLRGRGVGKALVKRLIEDARSEGFRIVPLCPFVKAQYQRHPEWSDVMDE
jgi:hypothetical protein